MESLPIYQPKILISKSWYETKVIELFLDYQNLHSTQNILLKYKMKKEKKASEEIYGNNTAAHIHTTPHSTHNIKSPWPRKSLPKKVHNNYTNQR